MNARDEWRAASEAAPARDADFTSLSGVEVEPVYGPDDGPFPGQYPYTRGPYASMYRSKLWTMRMFAGFGIAPDTNRRFHELLDAGSDGLSTAFDLPTLMGRDSDDELALGEVGKCGVAIDTLADVEDLYRGIDVGAVTTSMTINGPAAILLAMFVANAERQGTPRAALGGTLQNDILKEYQAQKEFIFPPRPSMRIVADTIRFCEAEMPRWHPISISGYHIREAGSTAAQELAFTLANGFAYVELGRAAGLEVDQFAPRLSFFFNAHLDFFEEIAKYRAARRIWARWMHDRYGARTPKAQQLRFHTQTAGVSLTAQQPEVNIVRTAIEALAGVLGGTQSLHTNSMDETLALPTERAARIALRTQQVIAHETRVANVSDPLGGSYYVEALTDDIEARAERVFAHLDELGDGSLLEGCLRAVEDGWFQGEIADSAYELERKLNRGDHIVVGVNAFLEGNDEPPPPTLRIGAEVEDQQLKRLAKVKADRDAAVVVRALERVRADACEPTTNLMPALLEASDAYATVGEICETLASVFGRYVEVAADLVPVLDGHLLAVARAAKGFMPDDEGLALHAAGVDAARRVSGPLLEVGTYCGKSAVYLGAAAREAGTVLFTVDHHRGSEENQAGWDSHDLEVVDPRTGRMDTLPFFRDTIEAAGLEDCVIAVVGRSTMVAGAWATPLAFLFIDGGHSEDIAMADYEGWARHVLPGGLLAIHDVFERPEDGGQGPFHVWQRAVADGFAPDAVTGSLRVLARP